MPKRFAAGDIFGVPLPDGSMALGQVLGCEREALNSVGCALFGDRFTGAAEFVLGKPIAVLLVTPDLLNKGIWPILQSRELQVPAEGRPYERFRAQSWVGVNVTGSANAAELLAAYHGLAPWDDWHDPQYLDKLLLPGVQRPAHVVLSKDR